MLLGSLYDHIILFVINIRTALLYDTCSGTLRLDFRASTTIFISEKVPASSMLAAAVAIFVSLICRNMINIKRRL